MPSLYNTTPGADLDQQDQTAATAPYTGAEHTAAVLGSALDMRQGGHLLMNILRPQSVSEAHGLLMPAYQAPLDTDTLNARYGVPGVLRFNEPTQEADAAMRQQMALQQQHMATVFAHSNPQPLTDFAASLTGTMLNPVNALVMAATGGLGEFALEGAGALARRAALGAAVDAATPAVTTLGKIANVARVPLEGAIDNAPFVGFNAAAQQAAGDDYDMGDALRDIAAGAVLHTAAHVAFRALPGLFRRGGAAADPEALADPNAPDLAAERPALEPDPAPPAGVPPEVDALPAEARQGAFVRAVEQMAGDEPVDVAGHIQTELETRATAAEAARDPTLDRGADPPLAAPPIDTPGEPRVTPPETPAAEVADAPAAILADTARRFATGDAGDLDTLRPPGRSDGVPEAAGDASAAERRPGAGAGEDGRPAARPTAEQLIAADPELKAIAAATDRYAADNGVTPAEPPEARRPATLADALHAAAVCLIGELG